GESFQGGDPGTGSGERLGHSLYGGQTDPKPCKAAGAGADGIKIYLSRGETGAVQSPGHHGQKGLAVGQPCIYEFLIQDFLILHKGYSCSFSGGINPHTNHMAPPVMVISRLFSSLCWIST